jgi:hypothetical protein
VKASVCSDLLGCGWLGIRNPDQSAPAVCPRCAGPLLGVDPQTGRFPTELDALWAAKARRVLGERGGASS